MLLALGAHAWILAGKVPETRRPDGPVEVTLAGGPPILERAPERATPRRSGKGSSRKKPRARSKPAELVRKAAPAAADDDSGDVAAPIVLSEGVGQTSLMMLLRLDRVRGTAWEELLDDVLLTLPDRHALLEGTGLDLFADFDAVLAVTPNPRDARATLVAARHHLGADAVRAALDAGARAVGDRLSWETRGRLVVGTRAAGTDSRLTVLAGETMVLVAPPSFWLPLFGAATSGPQPAGDAWDILVARIEAQFSQVPDDTLAVVKVGRPGGASAGDDRPVAATGTFGVAGGLFVAVERVRPDREVDREVTPVASTVGEARRLLERVPSLLRGP